MIEWLSRPSPRSVVLLALVWLTLCGAFFLAPQADIAVARLFFDEHACAAGQTAPCGTFFPARHSVFVAIRQVFHALPAIAIGGMAAWMAFAARGGARLADAAQRLRLALVTTFVLGPGLLVNVLLKDHWGRPRPLQVDLFGGDMEFVRAGVLSTQCVDNCSFVSGEAAGAFMLPLLALLAPASWRTTAFAVLAALALGAALLRVTFGAHWLSDALLGGLSTWVVFAIVGAALDARLRGRRTPVT